MMETLDPPYVASTSELPQTVPAGQVHGSMAVPTNEDGRTTPSAIPASTKEESYGLGETTTEHGRSRLQATTIIKLPLPYIAPASDLPRSPQPDAGGITSSKDRNPNVSANISTQNSSSPQTMGTMSPCSILDSGTSQLLATGRETHNLKMVSTEEGARRNLQGTETLELPYFAPAAELPRPLPTEEEIHGSLEVCMENGARRLVRVGPYMIKYGAGVSVIEGENMLFVSRETSIPVPRVYAIYTIRKLVIDKHKKEKEVTYNYIVMEHIDGHISQLRSIPSPGYYGSIGRRGLLDCVFWTGNDATESLDGPSDTEQAFNKAMRNKYIYNSISDQKAEFYRQAFPVVFHGHDPVFTHGDFQRKNIIVKRRLPVHSADSIRQPPIEDDIYDVTIIDWENAGWYPTYWESATSIYACGRWDDDWHAWVGKIMELFYVEYAWMQMLLTELWS